MKSVEKVIRGKTVYRFLVLIMVVGIVVSPFAVVERVEASTSVTNVWVELSDSTDLNTTGTDLEYIIHFTATTAPNEATPLPARPINWPVLWAVTGGMVVMGLVIFLLVKRKTY